MKCISNNVNINIDSNIWELAERKYSITIRKNIKEFISLNAGGYPKKDVISVKDEEYEVRVILSLDSEDEYYCITRPLDYFLSKTKAKVIPIAIDSGDNYYCVNNDTGKVYYWVASEDRYYCLTETLDDFLFE